MKSGTDDYWRNYFRTAKSDIFGIIEQAIMVAASDCPKEFRLRRDRIAEMLFSCRMTRCSGCKRVELAVPGDGDEEGGGCKSGGCEFDVAGGKESKENSTSKIVDHHHHHQGEMNMNHVSHFSYGEAEALTDELEEVNQHFQEVLRIKQVLENSADESDSVVFECLQRLQLMNLTVPTLKATEIGKTVNEMRRHGSKQIRNLAKPLIALWKGMVDDWVITTQAIAAAAAEGTPESVNPSGLDEEEEEEGLPSPPMDEAFFATQTAAPMELGPRFFDVFDEDGNLRNSGDVTKNRENGRRPSLEKQNIAKRKEQPLNVANTPPKDNKVQQTKRQETVLKPKPNKPLNTESGPGRPPRVNVENRISNETKYKQKPKVSLQERPLTTQEKLKCSDEAAVQMKLEATKRKLQERYQEAENAKRQRTVQVMELQDIPKQGLGHRNPHMKPGSQYRHRANGRR